MNAFEKKPKLLAKSSKGLILILIALNSLAVSKCNPNAPTFDWNPEIWAADSRSKSIVRKEHGQIQQIRCEDPRFDSMICTDKSEPRKAKEAYFKVVNQCEKWKSGTNMLEVRDFFDNELAPFMEVTGEYNVE